MVITLAVCAAVILRSDPLAGSLPPTPTPTTVPPAPSPSPAPLLPTPSASELERIADRQALVEAISAGRRALQGLDVSSAVEHLNTAALVDPSAGLVIDLAVEIAGHYVGQAESGIERADWEAAESELAAAAAISRRFGLDTDRLDQIRRHIEGIVRYKLIGPGETQALRAAIGLRVEVFRARGEPDHGILDRLEGDVLALRTDQEVDGGSILYLERIPLDQVRFVKAYPR